MRINTLCLKFWTLEEISHYTAQSTEIFWFPILQEYKKQVDQFEEMKKKEEKARQVRQQIIADMHKKSENAGSLHKKNKTNIVRCLLILYNFANTVINLLIYIKLKSFGVTIFFSLC